MPILKAQDATFDPAKVEATQVPLDLFKVPEGLEITLWAGSPDLLNPTNIDVDQDGRIWVAEGVRYRKHFDRRPEGDRIVVLEDTDGDGKADSSHTFVQEPDLIAPLGVAVIGKRVVVSQPPNLIVYTDNDGDRVFDAAKGDTREVLLTGFSGINHDHSLHSVTTGPDGKWYFNSGNTGGMFTDKSGNTFRIYGPYRPKAIGPFEFPHDPDQYAGQASDDGHTYVGGFTVRMNPDGTHAEIIGHNYRNSYEQSITSLGDVFQNDNDDPPACRVSWVMEYANFGFASNDGQRSWQADRRPGQPTAIAEWRQENPGITPAGDVYGGGSPTGNTYYENGALGEKWEGTFFACEPGRNTIFAYQPKPQGAGFSLERTEFITTNPEGEFAGSDFIGGNNSVNSETKTLFRPSDIVVGPDGALYVSDWIDPRVGGHQDLDDTCSGAIYRIAPKGFKSVVPKLNLAETEGQIAALKSPSVNIRNVGFEALKAKGRASLDAVAALLDDSNPYIRGRAIFLLYQLGISGPRKAGYPQAQADPRMRIAAYRAMRRAGLDFTGPAIELSHDEDPGVRREVALSMRDQSLDIARDILVDIAKGYDGEDRYYLEAFGTGATGKEAELYPLLKNALGGDDSRRWSKAFGDIAWRLHPTQAVEDFLVRASSEVVPLDQREQAMDAIAFIDTQAAVDALLTLAQLDGPLKAGATWWLLNRSSNSWEPFDLMPALKERGIYDPEKVTLMEIITPDPDSTPNNLPSIADILKLPGDAERGKVAAARCQLCHQIGGAGMEVGPTLDGWGRNQTSEVIANSIVNPSTDISHGYDGTEIKTKDDKTIHGLLIKDSDPFIITSMGGVTQIVPGAKIKKRSKMDRSLMLSAAQLGLSAQDVADLVAFLKAN
ncbi:MAG: c-type cytochrome [Verrucomicrobiae bacterium]|nr:c-type cytochrome [Verrucomicrobiae bacterium]